jgi:hypothetical protein
MRKEAIKTAELRVNHFVVSGLICAIGIDGIIAGICLDVRFMELASAFHQCLEGRLS